VNAGQFVSRLTRKSRSNFFYAFLCLPRRQRDALYAVYAFCRIVDDAVDLGQDRDQQRRELARWREEIGRVYGGTPAHPAAERLQQAIRAFPIPRSVLDEIITGVEMDLDHPRYETFEDLYLYCYRVASAVGLACIEIFGYRDPRARDLRDVERSHGLDVEQHAAVHPAALPTQPLPPAWAGSQPRHQPASRCRVQ
jgi:phytoene synthase